MFLNQVLSFFNMAMVKLYPTENMNTITQCPMTKIRFAYTQYVDI